MISSQSTSSLATNASDSCNDIHVKSLYVVYFDTKVGTVIEWSCGKRMDNIFTYNALPPNIQAKQCEVTAFTLNKLYYISIFNKLLLPDNKEERGARMRAIVAGGKSMQNLLQYIDFLNKQIVEINKNKEFKLTPDLEEISRISTPSYMTDLIDHKYQVMSTVIPPPNLDDLMVKYKKLIILIWKSIILNYRLLFFTKTEFSHFCYFINYLHNTTKDYVNYPLIKPSFVYFIGMLDIDSLGEVSENGWIGYTSDDIIMDNKNLFDILIKEEKEGNNSDDNSKFIVKYSNPEVENIMKINSADLKRYSGLINYLKYVDNNEKSKCSCFGNNSNRLNQVIPLPNLTHILSDVSNDYSVMLKAIIDKKEEGVVEINNSTNLYSDDSIILMKLCQAFGYKNIKVKGKSISFK